MCPAFTPPTGWTRTLTVMELVPEAPDARVLRGFAFVDVCGFTSIIDRCGDAAAVATLAEFRRRTRDACGLHGVRVAKWLGDGAMIVGVEPERLGRAVWDILAASDPESPRIRAGLAIGEVLVFEGDDYIGRTVNLAARLCDEARPGELVVAGSAGPLLASLPLWPREPVVVRGFRAPIDIVAALPATASHVVDQPPRAM